MLKRIIMKYGDKIAALSLFLAFAYSRGSCRFILHQPEEPEELKRMMEQRKSSVRK